MAKKDCYTQRFVRDYVALVHGSVRLHCRGEYRNQHRGLIAAAIDRTQYNLGRRRVEVNPSGKGEASQTQYECLAEYQSANGFYYTLLHLRLLTGRTHQIRVHCEHIGLPLVGDHEYARGRPPFDSQVKYCQRPFLHKLRFVFPNRRGDPVSILLPLEDQPDLHEVLTQLRLVEVFDCPAGAPPAPSAVPAPTRTGGPRPAGPAGPVGPTDKARPSPY